MLHAERCRINWLRYGMGQGAGIIRNMMRDLPNMVVKITGVVCIVHSDA